MMNADFRFVLQRPVDRAIEAGIEVIVVNPHRSGGQRPTVLDACVGTRPRLCYALPAEGYVRRMGRGEPIKWERRTATIADGRTITWTWQPAGKYPQIVTAHVAGELVADRVNADGTITRHADVAAELLRSIDHPDGDAHRPHP